FLEFARLTDSTQILPAFNSQLSRRPANVNYVPSPTKPSGTALSDDAECRGCQKSSGWRRSDSKYKNEFRQHACPGDRDIVPRRSERRHALPFRHRSHTVVLHAEVSRESGRHRLVRRSVSTRSGK